jgi:hypothetical protein
VVQTDAAAAGAPVAPRSSRTSILPAAAVLGLAVVMLVVFGLMNMVVSSSTTPTTLPVILGGLKADPAAARTVFTGWVGDDEPPANVASGVIAPEGARRVGVVTTGGGAATSGAFDLEDRVVVTAPRARVLGFYRTQLEAHGWRLISSSGGASGDVLLFQIAGSDGFYWEAGVTAQATGPSATTYTYRIIQVSDYS